MSRTRLLPLVVLALLAAAALTAAAVRDPWDPDETRVLLVTTEMLASGNPVLLTQNGMPYHDKPPLYFWLLAPLVALLGPTSALPLAIVSVVSLVGLAAATRRLARAAGLDPPRAAWAGGVAVTCLLPALHSLGWRMDLLYAVWSTLALERLVRLLGAGRQETRRHHLLLWLWLTLAVLTKGPLVLLLLAAGAAGLPRRAGLARRVLRGPGPLLALGGVAAWLLPAAIMAGPDWLHAVLVDRTLGRVLAPFAHPEPWWYHLATLPASLLPWSLVVVAGLGAALRRWPRLLPGDRLLAATLVAGVLVLSALPTRAILYPLPLVAAAAVLAARWIGGSSGSATRRWVVGATGVLLVGIGLAALWWLWGHPDAESPAAAALVGLAWMAPGGAAIALAARRRALAAAAALSLVAPLLMAAATATVVPSLNRLLSLRPLGEAYRAAEPSAGNAGLAWDAVQPGYALFSGRPFRLLRSPAELEQVLRDGRAVVLRSKHGGVLRQLAVEVEVHSATPYRHGTILVVRRR